jgi:hypothetical protein
MTNRTQRSVRREINPRFRERLPILIEKSWSIFIKIEPDIRDLTVHLKEFQEYLDFEIEKVKLEISKEEWKDQADRAKLQADKEWLAKRQALTQLAQLGGSFGDFARVRVSLIKGLGGA